MNTDEQFSVSQQIARDGEAVRRRERQRDAGRRCRGVGNADLHLRRPGPPDGHGGSRNGLIRLQPRHNVRREDRQHDVEDGRRRNEDVCLQQRAHPRADATELRQEWEQQRRRQRDALLRRRESPFAQQHLHLGADEHVLPLRRFWRDGPPPREGDTGET